MIYTKTAFSPTLAKKKKGLHIHGIRDLDSDSGRKRKCQWKEKVPKWEKEKRKINNCLDGIMAVEKPKLTVILGSLCM